MKPARQPSAEPREVETVRAEIVREVGAALVDELIAAVKRQRDTRWRKGVIDSMMGGPLYSDADRERALFYFTDIVGDDPFGDES